MSQPCGFLRDLLSCPNRQTYQTLIAPPHACPVCNGGFADAETVEMVQGPWGCNQMLSNHVGGNAPFSAGGFAPLAMTNGAMVPYGASSGPAMTSGSMISYTGSMPVYDHRLTGPYGPRPVMAHSPMVVNGGPILHDAYDAFDGGYIDEYSWDQGRRGGRKQKSRYKYKYSDEPAGNCAVM